MPDGIHRVDYVLARHIVAVSYTCFAHRTASDSLTFLKQLRTSDLVYRAVNATAAEQGSVRSIHDRVNFDFCYIVPHQKERHCTSLLVCN